MTKVNSLQFQLIHGGAQPSNRYFYVITSILQHVPGGHKPSISFLVSFSSRWTSVFLITNQYGIWIVWTLGNPANQIIQGGILITLKDNWTPQLTQSLISWGQVNGKNGHYFFADDIFKCIFSNENCCILISQFVPTGLINNTSYFYSGDKALTEPMVDKVPEPYSITGSQRVDISMNHSLKYLNRQRKTCLINTSMFRLT